MQAFTRSVHGATSTRVGPTKIHHLNFWVGAVELVHEAHLRPVIPHANAATTSTICHGVIWVTQVNVGAETQRLARKTTLPSVSCRLTRDVNHTSTTSITRRGIQRQSCERTPLPRRHHMGTAITNHRNLPAQRRGAMLECQRSRHACMQAFMLSARNIITLRLFTQSESRSCVLPIL
jgi:hypothetical protein